MILVAGGTGHLGGELIPRLMARGTGVRILTRDPARARRRLGSSPEFVEGDVRNPDSLDNAINFMAERDVAQIVELVLVEPGFERAVLDVGGPDNVSFNQLVQQVEAATGRPAQVRHIPVPAMRLSALLTRPFRPDLAGMIQAGIGFDTGEMRFDATEMHRRFPTIELTRMADLARLRFARTGRGSNRA